ncbi:MAG: hypothetical protein KDA42_11985, partial [Planctomycetales bacterium]|nr:hypothetical protein [Planctomycetales bacterium]
HEVLQVLQGDDDLKQIPAVVLSASTDPADIEAALEHGAEFYLNKPADMTQFGKSIRTLQSAIALRKLFGVSVAAYLKQEIEELDLTQGPLDDHCLAHLRSLSSLVSLCLRGAPIRGLGLAHLADLANLRRLDLDETKIDDESLRYLECLQQLESLTLRATQVTHEGVAKLKNALPKVAIET